MGLETTSLPIKAESIEEHEQILDDKMTVIKLEYVDKLFSKKIPMLEDAEGVSVDNFSSLLNRYTPVLRQLMKCYMLQKKHDGIEWNPAMYDPVAAQFLGKIFEFREIDYDHWTERTMQLLGEERKKIEAISQQNSAVAEDESEGAERKYIAGLINFSLEMDNDYLLKQLHTITKRGDTCISIHLEPLFKKALQDGHTNIFSSHSLEILAVQIVTKYPETKAIVASSWIVDTPIAKRIGFKVYAHEKYNDSSAFWGQFINSNGQIDNIRVEKFLETGRAPYSIATGAMVVEDFLRKYLPKEYRGKIILKESNSNFSLEEYEHDNKMFRDLINKNWDNIDETELQVIFSQCPFTQRFNESDFGKGFFDLLLKLKREQKTQEQLSAEPQLAPFLESYREFVESFKSVDKEVIIE